MRRGFRAVALTVALASGACGHSNDVVATEPDRSNGYMTGNLAGLFFDAVEIRATLTHGILQLSGEDNRHRKVSFYVQDVTPGIALPRTYRLFPHTVDSVGYAQLTIPFGLVFAYYTTAPTGARGDVTITTLTAERIEGTFSLVTGRTSGSPGTYSFVSVTSGEFFAKF